MHTISRLGNVSYMQFNKNKCFDMMELEKVNVLDRAIYVLLHRYV